MEDEMEIKITPVGDRNFNVRSLNRYQYSPFVIVSLIPYSPKHCFHDG